MQRFSKKQTHMLTSPPSLLAWKLGSIHLGHCLLLKDLLCSHSQLRGEDRGGGREAADLKGEGGLGYRTGVCSKGEIKGRKVNTASRIFTPARVHVLACLPSPNKSRSVERCHNTGSGAGGQASRGG